MTHDHRMDPAPAELGGKLALDDYLRERASPHWTDLNYLTLRDLREAVARFSEGAKGSLFDYGCGGAPYRELFSECHSYVRADVTPGPHVDRLLSEEGLTTEADNQYDCVFSSQVLEHVKDPPSYIRECWRILKPGGRLILTTHGMFEEHGCPHDYYRWTCRGLETLVSDNGFKVLDSLKMTTEYRVAIQFMHYYMEHLRYPDNKVKHYAFAVWRKFYRHLCMPVLNLAGQAFFARQAIVGADHSDSFYIGVGVKAEKGAV